MFSIRKFSVEIRKTPPKGKDAAPREKKPFSSKEKNRNCRGNKGKIIHVEIIGEKRGKVIPCELSENACVRRSKALFTPSGRGEGGKGSAHEKKSFSSVAHWGDAQHW